VWPESQFSRVFEQETIRLTALSRYLLCRTPVTTMKKSKSGSKEGKQGDTPSQLVDARIAALSDWRGETLARVRSLIKQADPEVVEAWKWRGVPVWDHAGIICTGETYKAVVKMTFAKGAALADPSCLFNASLEGNVRRAIDIHEGDKIDGKALKALIRAAVALTRRCARPLARSALRRNQRAIEARRETGLRRVPPRLLLIQELGT
jgi:hypothetical protein